MSHGASLDTTPPPDLDGDAGTPDHATDLPDSPWAAAADAAPMPPFTTGPTSLERELGRLADPVRRAFTARLTSLAAVLTDDADDAGTPSPTDALDVVAERVGAAGDLLWLAQSVLTAALPTDEDMLDLLTRARLGGTWAALAPALPRLAAASRLRRVEILRGRVTCDVHTTAESHFLSGIQRVVRSTTTRWRADHDVEFVGWATDLTALRRLRPEEHERMFDEEAPARPPGSTPVLVPWEGTHLWTEVITELPRTGRLLALTQYSRNEVGVLGHDCIPITTSSTVAGGMTSHFARSLASIRRADRVAMVSRAATQEFVGCMAMGAGRRDAGPRVATVPLPSTAQATTPDALEEARRVLTLDGVPMVLVVGSHEPRKNHLAVLHAAETLWREGAAFSLVFAGAGPWGGHEYVSQVNALLAAGRPVQSIRGLPDRLLWAAYRIAHCTVFPSLNEGFGLPVAESLAAGTPVITSAFGSMRDIVAPDGSPRGGLLVDPRDDRAITDALRTILTDHGLVERLRAETATHDARSWDDFAAELWAYLVEGVEPPGPGTVTG